LRVTCASFILTLSATGDRRQLTPRIHRQYLQALPTAQARHSTWVLAREVLGSSTWYDSLWQQRARIQGLPTLILWGMKDFAFRPKELARWQALFPSGKVQTFANMGHFVPEELGPQLCPLIGEFIEAA
jgi:haloalkane dehalogenase